MFNNPKRVFVLILLLALVVGIIDLPENYTLKVDLGPIHINRVINPPTLSFNALGLRINSPIKTHLGLDLSGGTHIALEADMKKIPPPDRDQALESAKQVIERRINFFGVSEPVIQTAKQNESYRIIVELPGVSDVEQAIATIGKTALLEFREFTEDPTASSSAQKNPLDITKPVGITGADLQRAQVVFSSETGQPEVSIQFTPEGAKKFSDTTTRLVGQRLAIFLDNLLIMYPEVRTPITDGQAVIQGNFTQADAKTLAIELNAGALPVPVSVVEKRTVEATLGQQSVTKSVQAGFIGLTIVAIFMIAKYGYLGLLADLALILYGLITYAIFRLVPVVLTLPGIAGFILSIGMAVDSNILIFERYNEERRMGKPWRMAMELGFGRAWDSIRDANFTTIITSLILFNPMNWALLPSSGLVRGFAATLLIGVLVSLFTGIVVTRTFIRVLYKPRIEER
jgi:preprotein translocase subunit SecD